MDSLTLMIIRHAEKPKGAWPGPGLTFKGEIDKKSLVIRGWQRAGAWSALFGTKFGGVDFPKPGAIYVANPNPGSDDVPADAAEANTESSQRPFETVTPLADRRWSRLARRRPLSGCNCLSSPPTPTARSTRPSQP
jgi:hypothetical protein